MYVCCSDSLLLLLFYFYLSWRLYSVSRCTKRKQQLLPRAFLLICQNTGTWPALSCRRAGTWPFLCPVDDLQVTFEYLWTAYKKTGMGNGGVCGERRWQKERETNGQADTGKSSKNLQQAREREIERNREEYQKTDTFYWDKRVLYLTDLPISFPPSRLVFKRLHLVMCLSALAQTEAAEYCSLTGRLVIQS